MEGKLGPVVKAVDPHLRCFHIAFSLAMLKLSKLSFYLRLIIIIGLTLELEIVRRLLMFIV